MTGGYFITVDDRPVERNIDDLMMLLSNLGMSSFLSTVMGPYLAKRTKERFEAEGDDVSGKWAPLKPTTIDLRTQQNFAPGPINHRTGELEEWATASGWDASPTAYGAAMRYPRTEPAGELRTKVETAQRGKAQPSTVARPIMGVNAADLLFFQAALQLAIEGAIR